MPSLAKLSVALAAVAVLLFMALASAQTTSNSSSTLDTCEACRDGNCTAGIKFCNAYITDQAVSNATRSCCCADSDTCGGSDTSCWCYPKTRNNKKEVSKSFGRVFLVVGAVFIALMIGFVVYYKVKTRRSRRSANVY